MASFVPGDRVLVNGGLVAEIVNYDEDANRVAYVHEVGGGTNTVYGHITHTRIERLDGGAFQPELPFDEAKAEVDE